MRLGNRGFPVHSSRLAGCLPSRRRAPVIDLGSAPSEEVGQRLTHVVEAVQGDPTGANLGERRIPGVRRRVAEGFAAGIDLMKLQEQPFSVAQVCG